MHAPNGTPLDARFTVRYGSTAECDLQGGKTILYSLVCIVAVIISLLYLTPAFYYIPKSTLGIVIIAAVYRLFDIKKMRIYYRTSKLDFFVAVTTVIGTCTGRGRPRDGFHGASAARGGGGRASPRR